MKKSFAATASRWFLRNGREVLPVTEGSADHPATEMSERRDHSKNPTEKVRIELCAKPFHLQVYDVLASLR
jgi:hypothetical protein